VSEESTTNAVKRCQVRLRRSLDTYGRRLYLTCHRSGLSIRQRESQWSLHSSLQPPLFQMEAGLYPTQQTAVSVRLQKMTRTAGECDIEVPLRVRSHAHTHPASRTLTMNEARMKTRSDRNTAD